MKIEGIAISQNRKYGNFQDEDEIKIYASSGINSLIIEINSSKETHFVIA